MKLIIVKIDQKIFEGDFKSVIVPALNGEMEVLPNHTPFLSPLGSGIVKYIDSNDQYKEIKIDSGFVEVNKTETIVIL